MHFFLAFGQYWVLYPMSSLKVIEKCGFKRKINSIKIHLVFVRIFRRSHKVVVPCRGIINVYNIKLLVLAFILLWDSLANIYTKP